MCQVPVRVEGSEAAGDVLKRVVKTEDRVITTASTSTAVGLGSPAASATVAVTVGAGI